MASDMIYWHMDPKRHNDTYVLECLFVFLTMAAFRLNAGTDSIAIPEHFISFKPYKACGHNWCASA